MRKILYSAIAVLGAASIATAAVMGGGSGEEECSISKGSCSMNKEMRAASVRSADAPAAIVPVANAAVVEKSGKRSCGTWKSKAGCLK